jgi:hypothetical protein
VSKGLINSQRQLTGTISNNGLWVGSGQAFSGQGQVKDAGKVDWTDQEAFDQMGQFDDFKPHFDQEMSQAGYVKNGDGAWVPKGLDNPEAAGVYNGLYQALAKKYGGAFVGDKNANPALVAEAMKAKELVNKAFYSQYKIDKPFDQYESVEDVSSRQRDYQSALAGLKGVNQDAYGNYKGDELNKWASTVNKYQPVGSDRVNKIVGGWNAWNAARQPVAAAPQETAPVVAAQPAPIVAAQPVAVAAPAPTVYDTSKLGTSKRIGGLINQGSLK